MDVVDFVRELNRMCRDVLCETCKIRNISDNSDCNEIVLNSSFIDDVVNIVQEWSEAHKPPTRLSALNERYPNCAKYSDGRPRVCAGSLYGISGCVYSPEGYKDCWECWNTPIEEE